MTCAFIATPAFNPLPRAIPAHLDAREANTDEVRVSAVGGEEVEVERTLEDFDLAASVGALDLCDVPAAMQELEAIRAPYTRAARRAGKLLAADFSDVVTAVLCARRIALQQQVASCPAAELHDAGGRRGRRVQREIEALTELSFRVNAWRIDEAVRKFARHTAPSDLEDLRPRRPRGSRGRS